jgi:serine/threonine protein kinase
MRFGLSFMDKPNSPQHLTSEEWRRICAVLDRLSEIEPSAREAALDDACRAEGVVIEQVRPFFEAHDQASRLPEYVAPSVVAAALDQTKLQRNRIVAGHRFGAYEVIDLLGEGGMGEVYKARDIRLGRSVAIKIVRSDLSENPDFRSRFDREARVISQLNHPNICTLHDVGHQDGLDFLVMEYVHGETLAERLVRGALPLEEVLRYGAQITDALDHAHRHGFVHRDLKPSNIILTKSGAKLLDFGLATLGIASTGSESPLAAAFTQERAIVGTLHYMAPEQVQGKNADARTDIFAMGAVLYEMLTGRKLWEGDNKATVIAAILGREPPALTIQAHIPGTLAWTIRTCLAKDPDERWQSAADIRHQLRGIASRLVEDEQRTIPEGIRSRTRKPVWAAVALAVLSAALIVMLWQRRTAVPPAAVSRFTLPPPDGHTYDRMHAIAPGASRIAFVAVDAKGQGSLWIRALDAVTPQRLAGTEGASYPFWSPDGRFIGFFADSALKKVDLTTGIVETICTCDTGSGGGATWNKDGLILFSKGLVADTLWRVPASGGVPSALPASPAAINAWPQFLPDGIHFLSLAVDRSGGGVYIGSLASAPYKRILEFEPRRTRAWYASGFLFFLEERALVAQPFDLQRFELRGTPIRIAEDVGQNAPGRSLFDVSDGGPGVSGTSHHEQCSAGLVRPDGA